MSSLKFGTSGLRGLVTDLVGVPSRAYTTAFLRHLENGGRPAPGLLVGRDLRSSSPRIADDCAAAAGMLGVPAIDCGALPTPALALAALGRGLPAVMVTGSHIPDDRNGLKFYSTSGEITKDDEIGILAAHAELDPAFGEAKAEPAWSEAVGALAWRGYLARNLAFFGAGALAGLRVGVYQHSSVARDLLAEVLEALGARVTRLGWTDSFISVDTEAHRPEDKMLVAGWARDAAFDAIVSTDGDADRPLVADETGRFLRGDVLGLLTARHLGVSAVATPVTSASVIERILGETGTRVIRTRVGSPFVLAAMTAGAADAASGAGPVLGFEANGGVLLGTDAHRDGRTLAALPTRDAFLPILAVLREIQERDRPLGSIVEDLEAGFTAADRLKDMPASESAPFLARLEGDAGFASAFFGASRSIVAVDRTDGVRVTLGDGRIVHYRASGNAPELRCYVEAESQAAADEELARGLAAAARAVGRG